MRREPAAAIRRPARRPARARCSSTGLVDIQDPAKPKLISTFPTPVPPADAPYKDFCEKGGRFGPHNTNILQHNPDVEKQGDLIYLTYFNAGLRIYDIKDARLPKEVGWFIPPTPDGAPHARPVRQAGEPDGRRAGGHARQHIHLQ